MYCAFITKLKDIRTHSNADKLQLATCFDSQVIIGLDRQEGEIGIFFPSDGKIGLEFAEKNKLLRKKDENGKEIGGYLDPDKRNIRTLKLRGEISDGLWLPLDSLKEFTDITKLNIGDQITVLNGVVICEKYIPKANPRSRVNKEGKPKKKKLIEKRDSFPLFKEHIDTSQLSYNKGRFKEGDICYITLKVHGTSARTSYTVKETKTSMPKALFKILRLLNLNPKPKKSWQNISGTRRVVLNKFDGGYYGNDEFRKKWHDFFTDKLYKGECVYYEIAGWVSDTTSIMPRCANKKAKDKDFSKKYGDETIFSYGCDIGENNIFVYRMTMTNEDGYTVEYPTELVQRRCEQMGVEFTPILDKFMFTTIEDLESRVAKHIDGEDPIGKTHVREGIVVRIDNRENFTVFKDKNFHFKCLEGIIKDEGILDIEEGESIVESETDKGENTI